MKLLKILALPFEYGIAGKPLSAKKLLVIGLVETLNNAIAPRLSNRDKDRLDAEIEAKSQHQAQGSWVAVTPSETEFIVHLQEVGKPHGFPAAQQALGNIVIFLGPTGLDKNPMTVQIDHIQGVKSAVSLDITGTHKVHLVDIIAAQGFGKIRILNPFGRISGFF